MEQIRRDIHDFQEAVNEMRQAIDREMAAGGRPTPDWTTAPPKNRDELPGGLLSVDGDGNPLSSGFADCVYVVNENFWDPQRAIERHLQSIEKRYRELVEVITPATVVHDVLRAALPSVHATLAQLPTLHAEFCAPEKTITVRRPTPTSNSDGTDQLARLLAKLRNLEELRTRADNGDQKAAHLLHLAIRLAKLLEDRGPDHPDTLDARHELARWRGVAGDPAGAAAAFAELVPDRLRVLGPDDPDTLASQRALDYWQDQARSK